MNTLWVCVLAAYQSFRRHTGFRMGNWISLVDRSAVVDAVRTTIRCQNRSSFGTYSGIWDKPTLFWEISCTALSKWCDYDTMDTCHETLFASLKCCCWLREPVASATWFITFPRIWKFAATRDYWYLSFCWPIYWPKCHRGRNGVQPIGHPLLFSTQALKCYLK